MFSPLAGAYDRSLSAMLNYQPQMRSAGAFSAGALPYFSSFSPVITAGTHMANPGR